MKALKIILGLLTAAPLGLYAQTTIQNVTYTSGQTLTVSDAASITASTAVNVSSGANITYAAGSTITLNPGFHAINGSTFTAYIPLASPGSFQATVAASTFDSISWTAPNDSATVVSYSILRNGVQIAALGASYLSFQDTNLNPGSTYAYTIVAHDSAGNSASASLNVTTAPDLEVFTPLP
jgi:hypothetical protein